MEHLTRRKLIQAGAAGTVAAGLGTVARLTAARVVARSRQYFAGISAGEVSWGR